MPEHLLSVDPGGLTGWALFEIGDGPPFLQASGEAEPVAARLLFRQLVVRGTDVACERYAITGNTLKKSRQYDAIELIGVLRFLTEIAETEFTLQTPADAKSVVTDKVLNNLGWVRGGKGHANDAIRHGVLWMLRKRIQPPDILL